MNNLRKLRTLEGLSQAEFAQKIGAAQNTVSQWELGTRDIDSERLEQLADFFNVSVDYLLKRTDDPTPPSKKGEKKEAKAASESDIKYAFFSGVPDEVSDKMFDQMKEYAEFLNVKYKDEIEKAKEKNE